MTTNTIFSKKVEYQLVTLPIVQGSVRKDGLLWPKKPYKISNFNLTECTDTIIDCLQPNAIVQTKTKTSHCYYGLETKIAKVMFLHLFVILFTGGRGSTWPGTHLVPETGTPQAGTATGPEAGTTLGRYTP